MVKFGKIFEHYFDMAIMGFVGGMVVYIMLECSKIINNKLVLAILTLIIIVLLIFIYSLGIWISRLIKDNLKHKRIER